MADGRNEGIQVTGGSFTAHNVAVGRGAQAYAVATDLRARGQDLVAQRLEELVQQLEAHAHEVPDIDDVRGAAQTVTEELAKERPNKTTVTGVLSGITNSVRSVSALAVAADALLKAVQAIF